MGWWHRWHTHPSRSSTSRRTRRHRVDHAYRRWAWGWSGAGGMGLLPVTVVTSCDVAGEGGAAALHLQHQRPAPRPRWSARPPRRRRPGRPTHTEGEDDRDQPGPRPGHAATPTSWRRVPTYTTAAMMPARQTMQDQCTVDGHQGKLLLRPTRIHAARCLERYPPHVRGVGVGALSTSTLHAWLAVSSAVFHGAPGPATWDKSYAPNYTDVSPGTGIHQSSSSRGSASAAARGRAATPRPRARRAHRCTRCRRRHSRPPPLDRLVLGRGEGSSGSGHAGLERLLVRRRQVVPGGTPPGRGRGGVGSSRANTWVSVPT